MTDKVQKIRKEVARLRNFHQIKYQNLDTNDNMCLVECGKRNLCNELLSFIDSLQEEPQVKESAKVQHINETCKENVNSLTQEPVSEDFDALDQLLAKYAIDFSYKGKTLKECSGRYKAEIIATANHLEPVSEDLEEASKEWLAPQLDKSYAAYGETKQMELTHFDGYAMLDAIEFGAKWQKTKDESCSKDLEEYINELSKQFPEVSFAKLSRIAVRVAQWQKKQMMAMAKIAKMETK